MHHNRFAAVCESCDDRFTRNRIGRDDTDLGLINDRHREHRPCRSVVGNGEGSTLDLIWAQASISGAIGEVVDLLSDRSKTLRLGPSNHRSDQSFVVEIDCDTEVDIAVHDKFRPDDTCVQVGEFLQTVDERPCDKRKVCQRKSFGCSEVIFHR